MEFNTKADYEKRITGTVVALEVCTIMTPVTVN